MSEQDLQTEINVLYAEMIPFVNHTLAQIDNILQACFALHKECNDKKRYLSDLCKRGMQMYLEQQREAQKCQPQSPSHAE